MPQGPLVYRQALTTRLTHWIWAVSLFFLMLTGLQIFNAHPGLHIGKEAGFNTTMPFWKSTRRRTATLAWRDPPLRVN